MGYAETTRATLENMLATLQHLASKAQTAGMADAVLQSKLAHDMFPLEAQFRIAVNQVAQVLNRLTGQDIPAAETELSSFDEVRELLSSCQQWVAASSDAEWIEEDETVDFTLPNGMRFAMSAQEYVRDWTMPNFYFHTSMAYALLRHQGLEIGKADLIPHMLRYAKAPGA